MSGLPRGSRRAEREMRIRAGGYRAAWSGLGARGEAGGIKTSLCGDDSRRLVFRMHLKSVTPRNSHDRNSYSSSATPPQPPPPGPAPAQETCSRPLAPLLTPPGLALEHRTPQLSTSISRRQPPPRQHNRSWLPPTS